MAMAVLTRINAAQPALAFLFTDIEGSTARWERHPDAMGEAVARHDHLLAAAITASGGTVIKTTGDGAYAVFPAAPQALAAAAFLQQRLAAEDFSAVDGLRVRVAVHLGPVEARDGDYYGPTLNRAARLMGIGHGGQVLVSEAAADAAADGLADEGFSLHSLGTHRLRDLSQPEHVYQLAAPGLQSEFPALRSLDARPNNLPIQASAFIGREDELAELRALISQHRLVTLLGAGGIGKTRLSLQAGADLLGHYPDGIWFIELAALTQNEQVAEAAAGVFNLTLGTTGSVVEQVASALRSSKLLIILDNCEHLTDGAAELAAALLRRSQTNAVLATSRSPLDVPGEQSYALPTLGLPAQTEGLTAAEAMGHTAIQLFVDRAGLASPGFILDDTMAQDIAAICIRLDGIALAIELAAARIRMLRPKELLARLNDRFRMLTGGSRTNPPRQQTLRALIDWSFLLLTDPERAALRRLAIFAGSFDLAGAEAVIAGEPIDRADVFDLVASLLDKSLLVRLPQIGAESRFRLLETTRQYALEKLAEAGETSGLQRSLAIHMVAICGHARDRWPDTDAETWRADYEPEIDNLRASLDWTFGANGDADIGIALAARLQGLEGAGLLNRREFRSAFREAVARLASSTPASDEAWIRYGASSDISSGLSPAAVQAQQALALFRTLGDTQLAGFAASRAAILLVQPDDLSAAQPYIDEAVAILTSIPRNRYRGLILVNLGTTFGIAGGKDAHETERDYDAESLTIARKFRDQSTITRTSQNLAELEAKLGNYPRAIEIATPIVTECRARRDWWSLSLTLTNLSSYNVLEGDLPAARESGREASLLLREQQDRQYAAVCAGGIALLAVRRGAFEAAAKLAGFSDDYFVSNGQTREIIEQRVRTALTEAFDAAAASGILPETERTRLMAEGAALSLADALALGLTV